MTSCLKNNMSKTNDIFYFELKLIPAFVIYQTNLIGPKNWFIKIIADISNFELLIFIKNCVDVAKIFKSLIYKLCFTILSNFF